MPPRWSATTFAILLLVATIPALTFASGRPATVRATATAHTTSPAATLRLAMPDTAITVDPALVADEENVQLASLLYSGLVRLDSSYRVVPDAAARIAVSRDHRVYTFYLRGGLHFSNGDPVTAQDFRYSINRSLNPALRSPSAATYLLDIQGARAVITGQARSASGVKVLNSQTLQITARWPVPYFLMELTYPTSFALDQKSIAKYGPVDNVNWYSNPVGSGPYRMISWEANNRILMARNGHYYGVRPAVGKISISLQPLSGSGADLYRFVSHTLDVVGLPSYDSTLLRDAGIQETKMLAIAGVYMSLTTSPFNNRHVRRALIMALDRNRLVHREMGSLVTPFGGNVPPGQAGYDPKLRTLAYSPSQARRELALGGFPGGKNFPPTTLYYGIDPTNPPVARLIIHLAAAIARTWRKTLKINVDTQLLTLNTLYAKAQTNQLPIYLSGWSADYPDPHDWLSQQWRTKALDNNAGYSNPKLDVAVEKADVTWATSRRMALYDQAQQILVADAAWIPLYIPHRLVYIRPSVSNLYLTGYGIIPRQGSWAQVEVASSGAPAGRAQ